MKKLLTILTIFCVMFTSIPMMSGTLESNALAKNITLKAAAPGTTSVKLTWNKVKSPSSGYAVFRNGEPIKRFNTKTTSYSDTNLKSGATYTYQIKTYKKTTKTQWYNKKTGKWQSKKPAKKYRGKSRKTTTYSYKLKSNTVKVQTKAIYYKITWENWDGDTLTVTSVKKGQVPEYTGPTPTRPDSDSYTYTFKGWSPSLVAAAENKIYTAQFSKKEKTTTYTITWKNWNGTTLKTDTVKAGVTPSYSGATPTRPDDDTYTYTFKGWTPTIIAAAGNKTYTATFTATAKPVNPTYYTITWKNWNGSVLKTDSVKAGTTPSYTGATPTKPADANYTYTFKNWSPSIVAASGNATYTAQFTATAKPVNPTYYTITWKNYDGSVLATTSVQSGSTPTYSGTPTKPSTNTYYYTFTGWTPAVAPATANAAYTATYSTRQYVNTPSNVKYKINNSDGYPKVSWNAVSGATGYKVYRTLDGSTVTTTVTTNSITDTGVKQGQIYEYYVIALKDSYTSPKSATISVPIPTRKTVIDYLGESTTIYKSPTENVWHYASNTVEVESMARIDKTVDGEFETVDGHMVQYHGATFNATEIANALPNNYDYSVQMYNGDTSKFTIELESGMYIEPISTYKEVGNHKYEQTSKYYYFKNGHPIAMPRETDGAFIYKTTTSNNITTKHFLVINSAMSVGDALGIWADKFNVYVKYDGYLIGTIQVDTARDEFLGSSWTTQTAGGMSPWRRVALNIAEEGIAAKGGSTGSVNRDLRLLEDYIEERYTYGQEVSVYGTTMQMKCVAGAIILETYAITHYNKFGFESSGSNYSSGTHSAFNLNEDPQTYYEAQGKL